MLNISFDCRDGYEFGQELKEKIQEYLERTLQEDGIPEEVQVEVSFSCVTPEEIQVLNRDYRQKDASTDVLSFPQVIFEDGIIEIEEDMPLFLGDIILNTKQAKKQAQEYNNTLEHEICYLSVHSLLHLLGYDHIEPEDKLIMRALEKKIMGEQVETV